jgi:hypothetical protein
MKSCIVIVATLALGSRPRQGFATVQAKRGAWEYGKVWEWTLTLPNELPLLGVGVPGDSRNFREWLQGSEPLVEFFISLENYWNLDVENGLAWPIWTFKTQVIAERKVRSQIGSLTPNHGKLGIDLIPLRAGGVWHVVGKLLTRATTLV